MIVYHDQESEQRFYSVVIRTHPWDQTEHDPRQRYVDFKQHPELIPETLVDFHPWRHLPEVEEFFELIRWLNGPDSVLETNDCGFRGPHPNEKKDQPRTNIELPFRATGRVMVLYRHLELNVSDTHTERLVGAIERYAKQIDPGWTKGVIGIAFAPVRYETISPPAHGRQVSVGWWLWGESEADVMAGLGRLSRNLLEHFRRLSSEVREVLARGSGSGR